MEIDINGIKIRCSSGNISINNGKIIIDEKVINCPIKDYTIIINGNCHDLDITGNLTVNGNVCGNVNGTGNITCKNIDGDINTVGNVTVKK